MTTKPKILSKTTSGTTFDVFIRNTFYDTFTIPTFGEHSVLNALAVIGVCHYEEIDVSIVKEQLSSFPRCEKKIFRKTNWVTNFD